VISTDSESPDRHFIMDYHADIGPVSPRAGGYTGDLAVADDLHTVALG
jgi:hypothetical protein